MKYRIKEIFKTIQGEGTYSGKSVIFIRFSGCNRWSGRKEDKKSSFCSFCDTDFYGGVPMGADEILSEVNRLAGNCRDIVLSGGEPLLQLDEDLCIILNATYFLHLETNGSKPLKSLDKYISHISMSPKQSKEDTQLERCDDLKILYPWIHPDITDQAFRSYPHSSMFLQPLEDKNHDKNIENACKYVLKNDYVKLGLQLHKILELR